MIIPSKFKLRYRQVVCTCQPFETSHAQSNVCRSKKAFLDFTHLETLFTSRPGTAYRHFSHDFHFILRTLSQCLSVMSSWTQTLWIIRSIVPATTKARSLCCEELILKQLTRRLPSLCGILAFFMYAYTGRKTPEPSAFYNLATRLRWTLPSSISTAIDSMDKPCQLDQLPCRGLDVRGMRQEQQEP